MPKSICPTGAYGVPEEALCKEAPLGEDLSESVTVYISSGPRFGDDTHCKAALISLIQSLAKLLPSSRQVVIFDGPHPKLAAATGGSAGIVNVRPDGTVTNRSVSNRVKEQNATTLLQHYAEKISAVKRLRASYPRLHTVVHREWMHQGNALRESMRACTTPIVFSVQDDIALTDVQTIHAHVIVKRLLCDSTVRYVRLYWGNVVNDPYKFGFTPRGQHVEQQGLVSMWEWSDRPLCSHTHVPRARVAALHEGDAHGPRICREHAARGCVLGALDVCARVQEHMHEKLQELH